MAPSSREDSGSITPLLLWTLSSTSSASQTLPGQDQICHEKKKLLKNDMVFSFKVPGTLNPPFPLPTFQIVLNVLNVLTIIPKIFFKCLEFVIKKHYGYQFSSFNYYFISSKSILLKY